MLKESNRNRRDLLSKLKKATTNHIAFAIRAAEELETDPAIILGYIVKENGGRPIKLGEKIDMLFMTSLFRKRFKKKFPGRELPPSLASGKHTNSKRVWREAYQLWPKGALRYASWGMAQVHPFPGNMKRLGYSSEEEMVRDLKSSARAQENSMINFIRTKPSLHSAIKRKDWWAMGRYYNGDKTGKYGGGLRLVYNAFHSDDEYAQHIASGPPLEGNVYLLGDSNTRPHSKYWEAYVAKNFGTKVKVINRAVDGHSLKHMLKGLKNTKELVGVIVGSAGGNNVSAASMGKWSAGKIKSTLAPDSAYYLRAIEPLMSKLSELQEQGAKVVFFGLPFGRGKGDECQNNTPLARGTMDEVLAHAAKQYNVPYYSVYKQTEKVKGVACGVHYGGDKNKQAYRDALRSANPASAPTPKEELAYAQSISSGGKKIKISHNRFLRPYRYLRAAGINFKDVYEEFKRIYGGGWEKKLLPKYGADNIFGPEHFAALKKYAKDTIHLQSSKNLMALINKKNPSKREPVIAKAEKVAGRKIEAVPPSDTGEPAIDDPKKAVADMISADDGDDLLSKIFGSFNESTGKGQKQKIRIILKS